MQDDFKPFGILCLNCATVNSFSNKNCEKCREKLTANPNTTVYYNGKEEVVICRKCGKYTNFKGIRCEKCDKKLKF